jgi:hypothetical protein
MAVKEPQGLQRHSSNNDSKMPADQLVQANGHCLIHPPPVSVTVFNINYIKPPSISNESTRSLVTWFLAAQYQ